jgi:hypothetical protein
MRKVMIGAAVAAVAAVGFIPAATASADNGGGNGFTMAVYGDSPYGNSSTGDHTQLDATPGFIQAVNADPQVSLVGFVGDIHSGSDYCTQAYDTTIRDAWKAFQDPLVYTPGDNEWSDCHKPKEGGGTYNSVTGVIDFPNGHVAYADGDPIANLALVRSLFFPTAGVTLGGGKMKVVSQATAHDRAHPADAQFVENVMFERKDMMFVTLNLPGGSNNDADKWYKTPTASAAQTQERADRTAADLRWLDKAFATATAAGDKAVVIIEQADMWDLDGTAITDDHLSNYEPIISSIATHTAAFGKPVLLFNGDSHKYRSDNPLDAGAACTIEGAPGTEVACSDDPSLTHPRLGDLNVENFHRVVVHGSTTPLEYLKLAVDSNANHTASANAFGPFSWQRVQP